MALAVFNSCVMSAWSSALLKGQFMVYFLGNILEPVNDYNRLGQFGLRILSSGDRLPIVCHGIALIMFAVSSCLQRQHAEQ